MYQNNFHRHTRSARARARTSLLRLTRAAGRPRHTRDREAVTVSLVDPNFIVIGQTLLFCSIHRQVLSSPRAFCLTVVVTSSQSAGGFCTRPFLPRHSAPSLHLRFTVMKGGTHDELACVIRINKQFFAQRETVKTIRHAAARKLCQLRFEKPAPSV